MAAIAASASGGRTLVIRGTAYPVLLPKLSDPRLHLASVIISLQILGQVAFGFTLSIAQILISLGTCAVLEVAIAFFGQRVLMWPASALLTGNGVAFILRVPGTNHGDWWSLRGWWIFAATAAVSLLSKYLIRIKGRHVFNPSNIGLVICFLVLGSSRAEPLNFWWAPMTTWMALALGIIVAGGFAILARLRLLAIAVGFWLSFAAGIGVLALSGHALTTRWHLGPLTGFTFWWALVSSPEILVFLFFMITDPKTVPTGRAPRIAYAASLGLIASLLIAPAHNEFWAKVAVLGSLAIVCAARPVLGLLPRLGLGGRRLAVVLAAALLAYAGALIAAGIPTRTSTAAAAPPPAGALPAITILPSRGVVSQLDERTARAVVAALNASPSDEVRVWLEPGPGQDPPVAVAQLASGKTYRLQQIGAQWTTAASAKQPSPSLPPVIGSPLAGYRLTSVAPQLGLNFTQGSFRFGVTNDPAAMMGGGLCWLDYNNDGRLDLFVVNSYADDNLPAWQEHGGLPRSALFRNDNGRFVNVTAQSGAGLPLRGEGCVTADLDGDGRTDIVVTTATDDVLLWNNGDGTFTEGARKAGMISFGWHSGATVADVNGDGRPDLFVAGYTDVHHPIPASTKGFPGYDRGVRDELFLNEGHRRFREVGVQAGLDRKPFDHSLGAVFTDFNGDGRPDLYVANDEDPNRLYLNERGGPLGFRFVDVAREAKVADPNAGMGIAAADYNGDGRPDLFVSNSRGQTHAVYGSGVKLLQFGDVRREFTGVGSNLTGWGDSWVDLNNDGKPELVLANGEIPVTNLAKDAVSPQVLVQRDGKYVDSGLLRGIRVNGRGLAAADYDNDGRVDVAINTIGGRLILLHNDGPAEHWLEVSLKRFSPGAVVTAILPGGRRLVREVQAGSSYLSSEDPRVHFGLGKATSATLSVRYPDGAVKRLHDVPANRIVIVR